MFRLIKSIFCIPYSLQIFAMSTLTHTFATFYNILQPALAVVAWHLLLLDINTSAYTFIPLH